MKGEIKKIEDIFPVTTSKAVYIDGTNKTLQQAIENGELGGTNTDLSTVVSAEKKVYLFHTLKIVINHVDKTITIPRGFRIQFASGNTVYTDYTEETTLDFSSLTNDIIIAFYWDNTDKKFIVAGARYSLPDTTHDLYLATSWYINNPDVLSLNKDMFIVKNDSQEEIIEMTVFGDSLTAYGVWPDVCAEKLNQTMILNNLGIGGSTMALADGRHNPMYARVSEIPSTSNVITVMAGTNDCGRGVSVGELGTFDTTTFIGAYEYVVDYILTNMPSAVLILMTLPPKFSSDGTELMITDEFRDATLAIAKKYRLPCINLHDELGINKYTRTLLMSDGTVHFNNITKRRIGLMLANKLEQLL